jgi:hypothetical protein
VYWPKRTRAHEMPAPRFRPARPSSGSFIENGATAFRAYWVVVFGASPEAPLTPPGGCHP